jgi:hypothetical protein
MQHVVQLNVVAVFSSNEGQREHPEIDEVLPVNAREAFGDDGAQSEVTRRQGRVFAA